MKKTILTTLILFIAAITFAQENTTYRATLKKMVQVSGSETAYKGVVNQMVGMFKQQQSGAPEEFWNEFGIELNKNALEQLIDLILPIYQKHLTETDLRGVIAFYETPTGKKFAEKTPFITQESMLAGQEWGRKIGEIVMGRLKEKGYLNQ